jgi:hypothetical protein
VPQLPGRASHPGSACTHRSSALLLLGSQRLHLQAQRLFLGRLLLCLPALRACKCGRGREMWASGGAPLLPACWRRWTARRRLGWPLAGNDELPRGLDPPFCLPSSWAPWRWPAALVGAGVARVKRRGMRVRSSQLRALCPAQPRLKQATGRENPPRSPGRGVYALPVGSEGGCGFDGVRRPATQPPIDCDFLLRR